MKLFLSSIAIDENQLPYFIKLVGKQLADISFTLIENATDPYPDESRGFVLETRKNLQKHGMKMEIIDLRDYVGEQNELYEKLKDTDVVWCGGGNTYYLRWIFEEVGFDRVIRKLLDDGKVYGGGSAGAVVAGPSLENYDIVDDPSLAPEIIHGGLKLIDKIIIPHWGEEEYQSSLGKIKESFDNTDYEIITLTDKQTFVVDNKKEYIIPSI